jgi:N-acetylglutamate synthase
MRFRMVVRITPADVGKRVVIRWRRPGPGDSEQIADVLGILEEADAVSFTVRTRDGKLVVIPAERALAGKLVPPAPARRRRTEPGPHSSHSPD